MVPSAHPFFSPPAFLAPPHSINFLVSPPAATAFPAALLSFYTKDFFTSV